ncbi:hypothetical protein N8083_00395 [Candidatus Pacebacteria bacterium]|nr:hypothetical protein [Candidatus Paceibacterota bacterium]
MDLYLFLIIVHLIGAILGVGGATMIEVHLAKALENKKMSKDERAILGTDYTIVRIGLILGILSGFGLLVMYKTSGQTFRLYDPMLWAKLSIIIVIAVNAILLQAQKMSLYWGATLSFVSWWVVVILSVFMSDGVKIDFFGNYTFLSTYISVIVMYVVLILFGAVILDFIRKRLRIVS